MKWFSGWLRKALRKSSGEPFSRISQDLYEAAPEIKNFQSQKRFQLNETTPIKNKGWLLIIK